jgi:hypothetical protein
MICAVLVNYKQTAKTIQCLQALDSMSVLPDWVIVVDNSSTEQSKTQLQNESFRFKTDFIFNEKNLGFAAACNQGIRLAQSGNGPYDIWLLNNDTVPEKDALKELVQKAKETGAGITGSAIYTENGDFSGGAGKTHPRLATVSRIKFHEDSDFDYIEGSSFFISHDCLKKTGLLSEEYFLYFEENDYCRKAVGNGFSLAFAPKSIIKHAIGSSTGSETGKGKTPYFIDCLMVRNRTLFAKKFGWPFWGYGISLLLSLFLRLKRGQFKRIATICKITISKKSFSLFVQENGGWLN